MAYDGSLTRVKEIRWRLWIILTCIWPGRRPSSRASLHWSPHMNRRVLLAFIVALGATLHANADCLTDQHGNVVCGKGQCETDQYGEVFCARLGGGAMRDNYGNVQCGAGYCAKDSLGQVWCATTPGASAALDSYGKVICAGACAAGTPSLCEVTK